MLFLLVLTFLYQLWFKDSSKVPKQNIRFYMTFIYEDVGSVKR